MPAITGRWTPPNSGIQSWAVDWLHQRHITSPRKHLSEQLNYIRKSHGVKEASEFRNYLLWLGVYPVKRNTTMSFDDLLALPTSDIGIAAASMTSVLDNMDCVLCWRGCEDYPGFVEFVYDTTVTSTIAYDYISFDYHIRPWEN